MSYHPDLDAPVYERDPKDPNFYEFFYEAIRHGIKSDAAGRPIFEDVLHIRIIPPGGRTIMVRPASDEDKRRYRRQWEAFQQGQEQRGDGLPLEMWPAVSKSQVLELKHSKIFSVEQLANTADAVISTLGMGMRSLQNKAKLYVEKAEGMEPLMRLQAENEKLKEEMEFLKKQFGELAEQNKQGVKKGKE